MADIMKILFLLGWLLCAVFFLSGCYVYIPRGGNAYFLAIIPVFSNNMPTSVCDHPVFTQATNVVSQLLKTFDFEAETPEVGDGGICIFKISHADPPYKGWMWAYYAKERETTNDVLLVRVWIQDVKKISPGPGQEVKTIMTEVEKALHQEFPNAEFKQGAWAGI